MSDAEVRRDLALGRDERFERTRLYGAVFAALESSGKSVVPRAMIPTIELHSPKITRRLTTDWFAHRVEERYQRCLARAP
jgi:hypothetical protein